MTEPFVDSETDRTKSRWVAGALRDFGRPRTTVRALFYYALKRGVSDYPICGKFVGEIRICRPYDESDGDRLPKWVNKARKLGFIPPDAILDDVPGEQVSLPETTYSDGTKPKIEVWINKSALHQMVLPACTRHGATLVSVSGMPSSEVIKGIYQRYNVPTIVLCLSDLSINGISFCRELADMIAKADTSGLYDIRVKRIGLTPKQVSDLKIPTVQGERGTGESRRRYDGYLKPCDFKSRRMAELDALEAYYPGGLSGFVEEALMRYIGAIDLEGQAWLLDLKKGVLPSEGDID